MGRITNNGNRKGIGAKFCPKCKRQGFIIDTRTTENGHVTRRYRCKCNVRWTTVEHYVGDGKHNSEHAFMSRLRDKLEAEIRADIRAALGLA